MLILLDNTVLSNFAEARLTSVIHDLWKDQITTTSDWLEIRGRDPGSLFLAVNKGGKLVYGHRMTTQAIYHILITRAKRAGVKFFTPHDLPRTFVSNLLDAGVDIATVTKMAGHSNIQTTAHYDRRPEETKQRAARLLYISYSGRPDKGKSMRIGERLFTYANVRLRKKLAR